MNKKAFLFNSSATYRAGGHFKEKQALSLTDQQIIVNSQGDSFKAPFQDVFDQYQNPPLTGSPIATSNKAWNSWKTKPFNWWQNQLNFAIWCATAGCGVSFENHLQATDPLLRSLYTFHTYYTTRRLLKELKVALPGEDSHSWYENAYDASAYKQLCAKFGVAPNTDWRQKLDHGCQGLGSYSSYMEPSGQFRSDHVAEGPFFHPLDYIRHNRDISRAWTTFILDSSNGFTQEGVVHLNDSIRTYVWAILGAQAQARSNIMKPGTGLDAQRQFLENVKAAIDSPVDIPASIERYQNTLQYASTPLDFVFGIGLYLSPSDMVLHPGNIQGYNNKIVIAGTDATVGHNPGINELAPISTAGDKTLEGKIVPPAGTVHRGPGSTQQPKQPAVAKPQPQTQPVAKPQQQAHEEEKAALVVGGIAVGLVTLWRITS